MEGMPAPVEVGDDRRQRPVAVPVDHVAPVAVLEQLGVVARVAGPRALPGAHADRRRSPLGGTGRDVVSHGAVDGSTTAGHPLPPIALKAASGRLRLRTRW